MKVIAVADNCNSSVPGVTQIQTGNRVGTGASTSVWIWVKTSFSSYLTEHFKGKLRIFELLLYEVLPHKCNLAAPSRKINVWRQGKH